MLKVNPTRMELLKLKKRSSLARRGHKLLRDKEEQLLIEFRKLVSQTRDVRKKVEQQLMAFYPAVVAEKGACSRKEWEALWRFLRTDARIAVSRRRFFNIPVQELALELSGARCQAPRRGTNRRGRDGSPCRAGRRGCALAGGLPRRGDH